MKTWGNGKPFGEDDIVSRLINSFRAENPEFQRLLGKDVFLALQEVNDLNVERCADEVGGVCSILGRYELETNTAYIYDCDNNARLAFTALHELGHHLLAKDEEWNFDLEIEEGERKRAEERMVNSFAARILIPDRLVGELFASGVSAEGIYHLYEQTTASLAACCARALDAKGERIVIYGTSDGAVWFSASNSSSIYVPKRDIKQPLLIEAAEKNSQGAFALAGGTGLYYQSGWRNTSLEFSGYVRGSSVILVGEEKHISRSGVNNSIEKAEQECVQCGGVFILIVPDLFCVKCAQASCPDCGYCGCREEISTVCSKCFLELSDRESSLGLSQHEDCF